MSEARVIPVAGHAELHLTTRSGHVTVVGEERGDVVIESGASSRGVETDATGRISLSSARGGSADLHVRCPAGSDLVVGTISGKVELRGQAGRARVTTVSGSVRVERAEELDVRSISGSLEVERCSGRCSLRTKSGRAVCGMARDARISTISGQIQLGETTGNVHAQSVSGTVALRTDRDGDVAVQTISGSVTVAVPHGLRPATRLHSLSSRPRCDCEEGDDLRIAVRSLSGRIEVVSS